MGAQMARFIVEVEDAFGDWSNTEAIADTPEQAIDRVNHRLSGTSSEARYARLVEGRARFSAGQMVQTIDRRIGVIEMIGTGKRRNFWVRFGAGGQPELFEAFQLTLVPEPPAGVARAA